MLAFFSALLQVNGDLKTIGALAGLIAVPGLAVLSLLYFGQAREVRRLREWAGRAPERAAELEQRVTADAQRRTQGGPATAPATPAARAATAAAPAAPAATPGGNGVAKTTPGAPATAAAAAQAAKPADGEKKEGETAEEKPDAAATEKKAEGEEAKKEGEAAGAEKKKDGEGEAQEPKEDDAAKEAKEPVAAAAAGPPTTVSPAATPAGATAAATAAARARPPAPPIPPRPAQPTRANVPSATTPPRSGGRRGPGTGGGPDLPLAGRISRGALIAIAAAVLVLGITVAIVLKVTGGGDNGSGQAASTVAEGPAQQSASSSTPATAAPVSRAQRAQTNVSVLNGTTVTGLARSVASRLQDQGYTVGNVTDAPNQAQPATKVEYGSGHHDEAEALATAIKVPASRVLALSPDDSTTAGPNAEVVVVVGQDSAH